MPQCTVHFETLGCRLNQIESESAARFFADSGFTVDMESLTAAAPAPENTVISVVNTCTVTGKAEQKARRLIRLLLRKLPASCVLVTGCYAELEVEAIRALDSRVCVLPGSRKDLLADIPQELARYVAERGWRGTDDGLALSSFMTELVERLSAQKPAPDNIKSRADGTDHDHSAGGHNHTAAGRVGTGTNVGRLSAKKELGSLAVRSLDGSTFTPSPVFRLSTDTFFAHSRSSIKIQDGCNCQCTYCRIHLARGRAVSLEVDAVVERVRASRRWC